MGMVRVSFGIYNSMEDVDKLIDALDTIVKQKNKFKTNYKINKDGDYKHKSFHFSSTDFFSLTGAIDQDIQSL